MARYEDETLLVDGFEIHWVAKGNEVWVTVSRDGLDAMFGIGGPREGLPPREVIEMSAMNVWRACHNLKRMANGLPWDDETGT